MEKGYISNLSKAQARNERRFGKKGSTTPQGYFGQKPSQAAELSAKRTAEHKARRGVKEEVISERQKDSDNQRLSLERGRSNYGKASIRNMRASGKGGNAADPAERLVAIDARHKAHKEKRGVKTKGKSNLGEEGYDQIKDRIAMAGGDPSSPKKMDATKYPPQKSKVKGDTPMQKEFKKKYGKKATALDAVKKNITSKYGKGAIMDTKKK